MKRLRLRRRVKQFGLPLLAAGLLWLLFGLLPSLVSWGSWVRVALGAFLLWACVIEPRRLQLTEIAIQFENLPPALDGLRIVQLSDLHVGAFGLLRMDFLRVVLMTERCGPDLAVITGDLVARSSFHRLRLDRMLLPSARLGVFAVLGNSDQKQPRKVTLRDELQAAGVSLVMNHYRVIEKDGSRILLVGVDDPVAGFADYDAAFRYAPRDVDLLILLTHLAHLPAQLQQFECPRLVLSGHTHGGQFRLPFALRKPDTRAGHTRRHGTDIYVNRGIGYVFPMRVFCPPEVTLITLRRVA